MSIISDLNLLSVLQLVEVFCGSRLTDRLFYLLLLSGDKGAGDQSESADLTTGKAETSQGADTSDSHTNDAEGATGDEETDPAAGDSKTEKSADSDEEEQSADDSEAGEDVDASSQVGRCGYSTRHSKNLCTALCTTQRCA
mgnify:CR=1 FL=1